MGTRAQRAILERPGKEEVQLFLGKVERKAEKARAKFEKRWNFSLVDDKPFEGRIKWETLKSDASKDSRESSSSRATTSATTSSKETVQSQKSSRRSSKSTIDKHFKLRKLRKKSLIDKPIVVQSVKLGGRNKGVKHRSSSTSSNSSKRNCSSYFLRPLSRRDYSLNQCTFTI